MENNIKDEFNLIIGYFNTLKYMKKEYPLILTYLRYLNNIGSIENMRNEIDSFKKFLILNKDIQNNAFNDPLFKTSKSNIELLMTEFIKDDNDIFEGLKNLEKKIFPDGKPDNHHQSLESALFNDPIFKNIIKEGDIDLLKDSVDTNNIDSMANCTKFIKYLTTIKKDLSNNKYTITQVMESLKNIFKHIDEKDLTNGELKDMFFSVKNITNSFTENDKASDLIPIIESSPFKFLLNFTK